MQLRILTNKDMKKVKLLLAMFLAVVTVSGHAQQTVGGLVIGQTYDYDYIISELGEPDYVSHDMYEFLVYKEKRPSAEAEALSVGPPTMGLPQGLTAGITFPISFIRTGIPFRILHCPA